MNEIFKFDVTIEMTDRGLKPKVNLYDSAVDIGVNEGRALEQSITDCVGNWFGH